MQDAVPGGCRVPLKDAARPVRLSVVVMPLPALRPLRLIAVAGAAHGVCLPSGFTGPAVAHPHDVGMVACRQTTAISALVGRRAR